MRRGPVAERPEVDAMNRNDIKPSEITPEAVFLNRRKLVAGAVAMGLLPACQPDATAASLPAGGEFTGLAKWADSTTEEQSPFEVVSTYNNYYEFGTDKSDPARTAHTLITDP